MYPLSLSLLGFNCFVDEAWPASDVLVTRDLPYAAHVRRRQLHLQRARLGLNMPIVAFTWYTLYTHQCAAVEGRRFIMRDRSQPRLRHSLSFSSRYASSFAFAVS